VSQQVYLSLLERSAEYEIVPSALDQGLGLLVWSPLAGGLLSGKYRRGQAPPEGARLANDWHEPPVHDEDKLYDTVDVLVEIAEGHGVSPARVAIAWLLARPGVTTVICGARSDEQLADNLAAVELTLSPEEMNRLEEVSRPPLIYPFWHQRKKAADRLSAADLSLIGPYLARDERGELSSRGERSIGSGVPAGIAAAPAQARRLDFLNEPSRARSSAG
jgi:diketogulonate reductase-like aldo/keto reductase